MSHQLLDIISVIQTGTRHNVICVSCVGRANGSCKFGSITGQPHVVLHALFLQLCDALIAETTAILYTLSFCLGNKGTQLHNCASDSLTSRWRFIAVGVIAAAALLFFTSVHWTRWSFHCDSVPCFRASGSRAAHHRGSCSGRVGAGLCSSSSQLVRIRLFSTSVILHFLAMCEVPFRFFVFNSWATESKTGFLDLIWPHPHTFAELLEFCLSRWLHASTIKQRENRVTRSHSRTREHFFNLTVIAEGRNFDAVWHSPVPTNKNSSQGNGLQTSSTHSGMLQFYCKCQTTLGWPRVWFFSRQQVTVNLSRKGTSLQYDRFYRVVLSRRWSFAVIVDFVCVFRSIWPQAHRCVCLM